MFPNSTAWVSGSSTVHASMRSIGICFSPVWYRSQITGILPGCRKPNTVSSSLDMDDTVWERSHIGDEGWQRRAQRMSARRMLAGSVAAIVAAGAIAWGVMAQDG